MMHLPLISLVVRRFTKRRGLLSGIAISGVGFGIAIIPLIASQLIVSYKWRNAELYLGIATVIIIILLAQVMRIKPPPETPTEIPEKRELHASV